MKQFIFIAVFILGTYARVPYARESNESTRSLQTKGSTLFQTLMLDGIHTKEDAEVEAESCTAAGLQCLDCNRLVMCIDLGGGNYQELLLETCGDDLSCSTGTCSDAPDPGCGIGKFDKFICPSIGMFPNPHDCRSYHICCEEGKVNAAIKCQGNYYYDPMTTYCKFPYPVTGCPANTKIVCSAPGQMGPHPLNRSIYYICIKSDIQPTDPEKPVNYYPKLYVCPNGKTFNAGKCQ